MKIFCLVLPPEAEDGEQRVFLFDDEHELARAKAMCANRAIRHAAITHATTNADQFRVWLDRNDFARETLDGSPA